MRIAEQVTFGGSALDRAAHLRGKPDLTERPGAQTIVLWRGLILMQGDAAVRLPLDHPGVVGARLFLGLEGETPLFAVQVPDWDGAPDARDLGPGRAHTDPIAHPALPGTGFVDLRAVMARLSPRDAETAATARAMLEWHRLHGFCAACGSASVIDESGWRRVCPNCGRFHFPRTDPVVIMLVTHGNSVLLGRSPGWPDRMYSLLAGFVEPGETMEAAVRREVFEEAGVRCGDVGYLASQPWPFPSSLMLGCRAEALGRDITLDPVELEDALWLTREETAAALAGRHPVVAPARRGAIAHFLLSNWVADRLA
ncbi:MAG: NAD(+) diphosphatase [Rhodobacterales bacterium]|nr:MAG: NAD(+) diphosphatase [Rhodobacterales bacterium]